jgi:hypothetical protein
MLARRAAIALIVLAIVVRAVAVVALQSHLVPRSTFEHGEIAANLLAGRGFSVRFLGATGPTSQQAPLYPFIVAAAYAIAGIDTPRAILLIELGQALLGGGLVVCVLALAREVAPGRPRVALMAAIMTALHPPLVYAATHVQVASLASTLLAATIALAYRAGRTGRLRDATATGVSLALLTLTDPILALVAPGTAWAMAIGRRGFRRAGPGIAIVALVAAVGVAPWMVRNALVHGELVWIKSTLGYAFWQGNCTQSEGTDKVVRASVDRALAARGPGLEGLNAALWNARHKAGYIDDIALTPADYRALGAVSEPERSRRLFVRAIVELKSEPMRYPRLCLRRLRYFVFFDETNPKTRNIVYRASHVGLTVLAVLGWLATPRDFRRRMGPTVLTVGLVVLFHTLTIVSARFHLPIEPLMGLWAATGLSRAGNGRTPYHGHGAESARAAAYPRRLTTS